MKNDWTKLDKQTIFNGTDQIGNRYLPSFLSDYKKIFNLDKVNAGCQRCLDDYYTKLIAYLKMPKDKINSGYELKAKYNGIPLKFGSNVRVSNRILNDDLAKQLIKNYKKGKELFLKLPKEEVKTQNGNDDSVNSKLEELVKLTREELDRMAAEIGIENPDELKNKTQVAEAILFAQKGNDEEE